MDSEIGVFILLGTLVGGAIIALVLYMQKLENERIAALAALAEAKGLKFVPGILPDTVAGGFWSSLFGDHSGSDESRFLARFAGFEPFGKGHSPEVANLCYGHCGDLDWALFDYSYKVTTSNGKSTQTTTYPFAVAVCRFPVLLPKLCLRPENFLHRIGSKLGMQDIQFELEEFNRRYVVQCSDEKAAYDLLHPQAIEYLMSRPARYWQMIGYQLVLYESGKQRAEMMASLMDEIDGFCRLMPKYVKEDRGFSARFEGPF